MVLIFIFFVTLLPDNLLLFSNNLFLLFELFSLFLFFLIIFCVLELEAPLNVNEICSLVCLGKIIFVELFELFLLKVLLVFILFVVNFCVGLLNPLFLILD